MPTFFGRELGPRAARASTWATLFLFALGMLVLATAGRSLGRVLVGSALLLLAVGLFLGMKHEPRRPDPDRDASPDGDAPPPT